MGLEQKQVQQTKENKDLLQLQAFSDQIFDKVCIDVPKLKESISQQNQKLKQLQEELDSKKIEKEVELKQFEHQKEELKEELLSIHAQRIEAVKLVNQLQSEIETVNAASLGKSVQLEQTTKQKINAAQNEVYQLRTELSRKKDKLG